MGSYTSFEEAIQSLTLNYGFCYSKFVQRPSNDWPKVFAFEDSDEKFIYENKITESDHKLLDEVIAKFGYVLIDTNISPCSYICICGKYNSDDTKIQNYSMGYYISDSDSMTFSEVLATYLLKESMGGFLGMIRVIHGCIGFEFGIKYGQGHDYNYTSTRHFFDEATYCVSYEFVEDLFFIFSLRDQDDTIIKFEGLVDETLCNSFIRLLRTKPLISPYGRLSHNYIYTQKNFEVI